MYFCTLHCPVCLANVCRLSENCYSAHNAYAVSKLAIIMMTAKLASVLKGDNSPVTAKSVHPGVVDSGLYQHVHWIIQWLLNILAKFLYKVSPHAPV